MCVIRRKAGMTRILHGLSFFPQETVNKCETSIHKMMNLISFWDIIYFTFKIIIE